MKKLLLFLLLSIAIKFSYSQASQVTVWYGFSGNSVTGVSPSSYAASESIYLASEIGASNFLTPGDAIDRIGFNVDIVSSTTSFPGFNVYLKDVPAATTDLVTGPYSLSGYTLVFSGTLTANAVGWTYLDLSTPYIRLASTNNLEVLIVKATPVAAPAISWNCAVGNSNDVGFNNTHFTTRRYAGSFAPAPSSTSLVRNAFRPMLYLSHVIANDISFDKFTSVPNSSCYSATQSLSAVIKNLGTSVINIADAVATLTVTGANSGTYNTSNATVLAPGATEVVSFTGINLANVGTNNYAISFVLAGDANVIDNSASISGATAPIISSFPSVEDAEVVGLSTFRSFVKMNATRQLWTVRTTSYTNLDQVNALNAHGGSKFLLFDAYVRPSFVGFASRYYSDCFALPAGECPKISFWMSHDNTTARTALDSMYVSVSTDKGITWVRQPILGIGVGLQRHDASLGANIAPIWRQNSVDLSAFAGQTIQIGFEGVGSTGNAFGLDDITVTSSTAASSVALETTPANYTLGKGCEEGGWTYYNDVAGNNVLAVEWGTNTASKAAATATLTLDAANYAATAGAGPTATGTFTMKRYWNIDVAGVQPSTAVNVRFFYDVAEKNATDAAALAYQTANTGSGLETPRWFKTTTGSFVGDAVHVTDIGVQNAIPLTDVNTGVATINGVLYAQFNGITSFSGGGYAAGVGAGSVLPVGIQYIKGTKQGVSHLIDWKVSCTAGTSLTLTLERSADGRSFSAIHNQLANDVRCLQPFSYVDASPLAAVNYYRIKITTADGVNKYSTIVVLLNKEKGFELISVAPNPVKDNAVLTITSAKAGKIDVLIRDIAGKFIEKQSYAIIAGSNAINLTVENMSAGTYSIMAVNMEGEIKTMRFVKL
jgi:hypothetical protein